LNNKEFEEFKIEKLHYKHSLLDFDCGDIETNDYFNEKSFEDVENKNAQVYVFLKNDKIIGFYALSTKSVRFPANEGEPILDQSLLLIGQLGVNKPFQGKKWGAIILNEAIKKGKMISMEVGCIGIIIETYKKHLINKFFKKTGFKFIKKDHIKERGYRYTLFYRFPIP